MKKLLCAAALMCVAMVAHASNTIVTATVTDTDGQLWLNGQWGASLSLPSGPFGNQTPTVGGVPVPTKQRGLMDGFGVLHAVLADVSSLDQPGGVWTIQVCPNSSVSQYADTGCVKVATKPVGGTIDLSSQFSGMKAPRFPAGPNAYGYSDIEVIPPSVPGVQYYNTGSVAATQGMRVWDGNQWNGVGASGGGGSPPGGQVYEIQSNQNGTAFSGSGFFTNSAHSYLYTPVPQQAQYARNSPVLSYCGGRACGDVKVYAQDTPLINGAGQQTGFGQSFFNYRSSLWTGLAVFNGYGNSGGTDPQGGSAVKVQDDEVTFQLESIAQDFGPQIIAGKPFDTALLYGYLWNHGGYRAGGDEGDTTIKANGGNLYTRQGGSQISGNPGKGATTLTASQLFNASDIAVGMYMYNFSAGPLTTGNITNYDAANHLLTVSAGSVTPPTNSGTSTTNITITTPNANGTSLAVTVHVNAGTGFTIDATNPIIFGCLNLNLEFVVPSNITAVDGSGNQIITALFQHGHPSGCMVWQGGTSGPLDLTADRLGANWKTSYWVGNAPDNSHIYEFTYISGGRGFINDWRHNFGTGQNRVTNAQVSRTSNVIKVCNLGQSDYNFAGQYVRISGATPSDYNGTYVASILDANYCITMAGAGADGFATGATVQTGGDVNSPDGSTLGTGGFNIWQGALLKQIGTTTTTVNGISTNAYNGQLFLYPNSMTVTNGQYVFSLDDMQNKTEVITAAGNLDTAPNGSLMRWMSSAFQGNGVTTQKFIGFSVINGNNSNMYKGGGGTGTLDAPLGIQVSGLFSDDVQVTAPIPRGAALHVLPNAAINANSGNNTYFVFRADGLGGNAGAFLNYNPATGTSILASGTGNGITSGITMTPSTMTLGATGAFTFGGSSYTFTGFGGAPAGTVGCAKIDGVTGVMTRTALPCGTISGLNVPAWASVTNPLTATPTLNLPAFIASGASHAAGVVPDPGSTAGTSKYLREDGTWQVPPGVGAGVSQIIAGAGITISPTGGTGAVTINATGGGTGTVTSFSASNPSALFTTSVATATTTPALSFTLSTASAHSFFGNCSGTAGAPNYCQLAYADITGTVPTWNQSTTGNAATATALAAAPSLCTTGQAPTGILANGNATGCASIGGGGITGLTTGYLPQATSSTAIGNSFIDYGVTNAGAYTSTKDVYAPAFHSTATGAGFGFIGAEGTAPSGVSGQDGMWADSTAHRWRMNNNNAGALTLVGIGTPGTSGHIPVFATNGIDLVDSGASGVSASGTSCTITAITSGIITGATCTP